MVNVTDPPTKGLSPTTDVSFHYWLRVYWLLLGIAVVAVASLLPDYLGDTGPTAVWVILLLVSAALTVVALVSTTRMQKQLHVRPPRLRWPALVLTALVAAHFGDAASMKGETKSILEIELAGSSKAWDACDCDDAFTSAVHQDFWFIPAYVLLLALIAFWAGAYFRLPAMRRARKYVVIAVVVAGALDVVENILMLNAGGSDRPWLFAAVCAWAKFALLLVAIGYALAGAFAWWSTPRWVRLASWALPAYAKKSVNETSETEESKVADEATPGAPEGTQIVREAIPRNDPAHGIALSGGGIRASSISLGALQVLDGDGTLGWTTAHQVTAVSGGSNMAAGWSISRSGYTHDDGGNAERVPLGSLDTQPWQMQDSGWLTIEERHLVDNLGYLASNQPRGSATDPAAPNATRQAGREGDQPVATAPYRPAAYATVIAGLTVNTIVLLSMLWAITRPVGWALRGLADQNGDLEKGALHDLVTEHSMAVPGLSFLAIGFLFLMAWVGAGQFLIGPAKRHAWARTLMRGLKGAAYGALGLGAVLALTLWGFVELVGAVAYLSLPAQFAAAAGAAGVIGSVVRILRKPAARFAPMLGGLAFLVVALCLAALATWSAAQHGVSWAGEDLTDWRSGWNWVAALALLAFLQLAVSPERWSLAPFYRGKLRLAYATYRTASDDGRQSVRAYENDNLAGDEKSLREPGLSAFNGVGTEARTPLVVCTTGTVSSRAVRTHYGTPALSVTFDPDRVTLHLPQDGRGNTLEYAASTKVVDRLGNKLGKRVTTMLAVAISSAAVSPAMGRIRIGPTSMLLTFFNIRLGVWVANPRFVTQLEAAGLQDEPELRYPRTGLGYLFKEFFGIHDLDDPYLYLTDGGHWENTGLVELLRVPEVTEIVCVDADSGPGDATSSLGKAIAIAPSECDIRIDMSLDPLRAAPSGSRVPAYSPRTVNIGFFSKGAGVFTGQTRVGVLWYAKPGLTKGMPAALLAFHERNPSYPRISTLDQFFDTATFVAYRNLGRYNAHEILLARRKLTETLAVLLAISDSQALDDKLSELAPSHWVIQELARAAHGAAGRNPQVRADKVAAYCRAVSAALVG
ncbi:hypothetical protein [Nocardioides speluncae]|uniref:hypothetical protein n=1 Tax=Nocardioides speluncae TaxID=2670337 RepID=UPI000D68C23A|nr:hypothetical protein [Nocardioides speluncae]